MTDNCGIADALAALRGSDNLLMDMVTDPEFISRGIQKLMPIYKETQEELFSLTYENNEGSILFLDAPVGPPAGAPRCSAT